MPRKYKRDPHLPPPEVCDWLLSQKWEGPEPVEVKTSKYKATHTNALCATAALGTNDTVELLIDADALEVIQKDARDRVSTVDDVLAQTAIGCGMHQWAVIGGSITLTTDQLRPLLEEAYDPANPDWEAMVDAE
ncbi:MAG: hypothetical protein ACK5NY_03390 [Burkholderiaceae bacterium]